MLPASNRAAGTSVHFPDLMKGPAPPPVPFILMPLPNFGFNALAAPFSPNVMLCAVPATNMASLKTLTAGDEAGVLGGLITGGMKAPGMTMMGNPKIFVNCIPAESLLNPTTGNNFNAMVGAQLVPSAVNVFYTFDGDHAPEELVAVGAGRWDRAVELDVDEERTVLRLRAFERGTARKVWNLLEHEPPSLVIDLRGNPGGDADAALELADDFLPRGTIMALARDQAGELEALRCRRGQTWSMPVEVWVDAGTASAAELFAAVLQHQGRATLRGEATRGKAHAEALLACGTPTLSPARRYFLPDGTTWSGTGLAVDRP